MQFQMLIYTAHLSFFSVDNYIFLCYDIVENRNRKSVKNMIGGKRKANEKINNIRKRLK